MPVTCWYTGTQPPSFFYMKKFIFDVDGTLTESRKQMDISFMSEFIIFCCKFDTYLVTGSDRDKTVEQVGLDVYNRAKRVFNCSGADIYEKRLLGGGLTPSFFMLYYICWTQHGSD